jgi:hypothetical protein
VTSDSTQSKTGPRSLKCDSGAANDQAYIAKDSILADAGRRISAYVRFDAAPSSNATIISLIGPSSVNLQLNTLRKLVLLGTTGSATLSTNTWYRIAFSYTITNTTTNEFRVFVNGTQDISVSNATLGGTGVVNLGLGWVSAPGASKVIWVDDVYVDDSTALTDPGDLRVTAKRPNAENTNSFDTAIGAARGSTDYNNVNERPVSLTNGWRHAASTAASENYGIESASQGDVDISSQTLVSRCAWLVGKTGGFLSRTKKLFNNGTEVNVTVTAVNPSYASDCVDSATYPSNAAAVGMGTVAEAEDTFLYECGMLIASTPPTGGVRRLMIVE